MRFIFMENPYENKLHPQKIESILTKILELYDDGDSRIIVI